MKRFKVWFRGTNNALIIKASTRQIAILLFAEYHQVIPSSYIQARIAKNYEVAKT